MQTLLKTAIDNCKDDLARVELAILTEMHRIPMDRRQNLLLFLYKEKEVFSYALSQLQQLAEQGL